MYHSTFYSFFDFLNLVDENCLLVELAFMVCYAKIASLFFPPLYMFFYSQELNGFQKRLPKDSTEIASERIPLKSSELECNYGKSY